MYEKILQISENEAAVDLSDLKPKRETIATGATPCIICGENVIIYNFGKGPKVCSKCRQAVMRMREQEDYNG